MILSLTFEERGLSDSSLTTVMAKFRLDDRPMLSLDTNYHSNDNGIFMETNFFRFTMPCCGGQVHRGDLFRPDCSRCAGVTPEYSRDLSLTFGGQCSYYNKPFLHRFVKYYISASNPQLLALEVAMLTEELMLQLEEILSHRPTNPASWPIWGCFPREEKVGFRQSSSAGH